MTLQDEALQDESSQGRRASSAASKSPGNKLRAFVQLVKFNAVGVLNTAVDFAVFTVLTRLGLYALLAQCLSYSCGIVNSYLFNRHWTFAERNKKADPGQAVRFFLLNLVTLGISLVLLFIFHDRLGLQKLAAKAIVTVFTTGVNFVGSRLWVFKTTAEEEA